VFKPDNFKIIDESNILSAVHGNHASGKSLFCHALVAMNVKHGMATHTPLINRHGNTEQCTEGVNIYDIGAGNRILDCQTFLPKRDNKKNSCISECGYNVTINICDIIYFVTRSSLCYINDLLEGLTPYGINNSIKSTLIIIRNLALNMDFKAVDGHNISVESCTNNFKNNSPNIYHQLKQRFLDVYVMYLPDYSNTCIPYYKCMETLVEFTNKIKPIRRDELRSTIIKNIINEIKGSCDYLDCGLEVNYYSEQIVHKYIYYLRSIIMENIVNYGATLNDANEQTNQSNEYSSETTSFLDVNESTFPSCADCEVKIGKVICFQCSDTLFCDECFKSNHSKKGNKTHYPCPKKYLMIMTMFNDDRSISQIQLKQEYENNNIFYHNNYKRIDKFKRTIAFFGIAGSGKSILCQALRIANKKTRTNTECGPLLKPGGFTCSITSGINVYCINEEDCILDCQGLSSTHTHDKHEGDCSEVCNGITEKYMAILDLYYNILLNTCNIMCYVIKGSIGNKSLLEFLNYVHRQRYGPKPILVLIYNSLTERDTSTNISHNTAKFKKYNPEKYISIKENFSDLYVVHLPDVQHTKLFIESLESFTNLIDDLMSNIAPNQHNEAKTVIIKNIIEEVEASDKHLNKYTYYGMLGMNKNLHF